MLLGFAGVLHLIFLTHAQASPYQTTLPVTCEDENICTPTTSHVFIRCSYTNTSIQTVIWFSPKQKEKWKNRNYPEDLTLDSDLAGRVNHTETLNSSTLTIRDVRLGDSGEYRFILVTANGEKYLSSIAVKLTVTDLQVRIHPGITEQELRLTCNTQCRLTTNWNSWWKDGKRINAKLNTEALVLSADDGGSYFCSVKTKAKMIYSPAVYFQVRVSFLSMSDGQTVALSCITSCTLPKHAFNWYQNSQRVMNKLTKYNNLYLDGPSYKDRDTYTCAVRDIDMQNVTEAPGGEWWWIQYAIWAAGGFMAVLTLLIAIQLIRRARRKKNDTQSISNPVDDDIYTGLDSMTMSSTYATLGDVEDSLTDTYTTLSSANRSSEYSTLFIYSRKTSSTETDRRTQVAKVSASTVQREASDSAYENVECKM
ncbi:uncharacterized protein LOC131352538 isoform X3 [Hemibagrus wyckioides]|uniref:uncharacterized protein LOC131352538 isoform X3 n=1 Tax=Hemibagrus wyckioides TaxID=337641 RepID=UPI00266CF5EB|nr:uncharacterized protein LOC131352538 isoform X3 [Hemibagrus wyckioides]